MSDAVRSTDLAVERWDLISYSALAELARGMETFNHFDASPVELVGSSVYYLGEFLAGNGFHNLREGWAALGVAIQRMDMDEAHYEAWAVTVQTRRSGERKIFGPRFDLIPYTACRRLATTCHEGATKYGMHNWLSGFQVYDLLNHTSRHLVKWLNG